MGSRPKQPPAQPTYTPPKNSVTTATTGPQVRRGQPSQGGFQVLSVRPKDTPSIVVGSVSGGGGKPPEEPSTAGRRNSGAGGSADETRGLIKSGAGRSLLAS
jgi:hypothetical protein